MEYTKNCPKCGKIQRYATKKGLRRAIKANTKCKKCGVLKLTEKEAHRRLLERVKKYQQKNKDIIKIKKRLYRQKHKNEIQKYNKQYTNKNKDKIKIYQKRYTSKISFKEKRRM